MYIAISKIKQYAPQCILRMAHVRTYVVLQDIGFFFAGREKRATRMKRLSYATRIGDWHPLSSRCFAPTYRLSNVRDHSVQQEETVMHFGKTAFAAATLCVTLAGAAFAQDSVEPASITGCMHMAKRVSAALDANQSSASYGEASTRAQGARGFCAQGMYKQGIDRYAKALELLAAS